MAQYGVTAEQISSATGYTTEQVVSYVAPAPVDNSAQEAAQAQAQAEAEAAAAAQWEAENAARWEAEQAQRWEAQQQAIRDQQAQQAQQQAIRDQQAQEAQQAQQQAQQEQQRQAQQEQQRQAQEQAERAQAAAQREIQLQEERDAAETRNRNNVVAGPVTPQVTDADILGWMNANPNASMEVIADTMRQAGVSSERLGQVTGQTLEDRIAATQAVAGPVAPPSNTLNQMQVPPDTNIAGPVAPDVKSNQLSLPGPQSGSALSNEQVDKIVRDAYAGIGRTGTGTGVSQVDQAGYDAFASALKTGTIAPADFNAKFQDAVKQYMIDNPTDPYSKYVGNYLVTNKKEDYVAGPTTSQVVAAIDKWSADNPNATTEQLAKAIDTGMGLTDTVKLALAQKYNIPTTDVVTVFNKALDPYAGVQINDYQGKSYDAKQLMNLASQIAGNLDTSKSGGGVFSTKGESVGFDYNTLTGTYGGKTFSSADQVAFDMARGLLQQGITDYSQLKNLQKTTVTDTLQGESGEYTQTREVLINPATGQEFNTQLGYTASGKGGTEYYVDTDTGKTYTKGISSSDLDGGLGMALSIGASFLLPGVGAIIAAELGVSAAVGTALANAGLQLAMGADPKSVLLSAGLNLGGVTGDVTDYLKGGITDLVGTDFAGLTGSQLTKFIDTAAAAVTRAGTSFLSTGDAATALTAAAGSVVNDIVTDKTGSNVLGAGAAAYLQTGDLASSALVAANAVAFNAGKTFKTDIVDLFNGAKNTVMQNTVADNLTTSGVTQAQLDNLFDPSKNPYLSSTELNTLAGITTGTVTDAGAGSVQQLAEGAQATYGSWQPMTDGEGQKRYVEVKNADGEVVDSFYETVDKSGAIGWQKTAENLEGSEKTMYITAGKGKYPFEILTTSDSKEIGSPTSKAVKPTDFTIGGGTPGALTSNATGATATATSNNANVSTANTATTSNNANTATTSATSNNASVVGGNANVIVGGTTIGGTGSNTTGGNVVTLGTGSGNIATVGGIGANGNITLSTGGGNGNVGNLGTGGNGNAIIGGTGGNGNAIIGGVTGNGNVVISGTGGDGNITLGNVTTNANITTNTVSNLSNVVSNIFTDGNVITVLNTPNTVGNTLANTTTTINTGQGVNPIKLTSGGLNPGWIAPTEFYDTNSPVQSQFYWGQHPYQQGTTFNSALYNSVPNAPAKPWGIQQIAGVDPNTQLQYANNWFNPAAGALAPQAVQVASPRLTPISPYVVSGPITP
jgi:hypothetical protein